MKTQCGQYFFLFAVYEKMRNAVFTDYKQLPLWKAPTPPPPTAYLLHSYLSQDSESMSWHGKSHLSLKSNRAEQRLQILTEAFQQTFLLPPPPLLSLQPATVYTGGYSRSAVLQTACQRNVMTNFALQLISNSMLSSLFRSPHSFGSKKSCSGLNPQYSFR